MTRQDFTIRPVGRIKGGSAYYELYPEKGQAKYFAEIQLPLLIGRKSIGPAWYPVDMNLLVPEKLNSPGAEVKAGPLTFKASNVQTFTTVADVYLDGKAVGSATFDTSQKFVTLKNLSVSYRVPILGTLLIQADEKIVRGFVRKVIKRLKGK